MNDDDPNAPWLTLAHIICTENNIENGDITYRLNKLRDLLDELQTPYKHFGDLEE